MKRILTAALLACSMVSGAAFAEKYDLLNDGANYSPLHNNYYTDRSGKQQTLLIETWCATLIANATGNSYLTGGFIGSDKKSYSISMTLTDTYFTGSTQHWGDFSGKVAGNGRNISLNDIMPGRDAMDAVLGINVTPYNNGQRGGNTAYMEFGFWGDNSPGAHGTRNSDANTHVACIADTRTGTTRNNDGSCGGGNTNVPLPGTLALTSLALLGLGIRRKFAR
jgi:hypothetical protein